ncbi:hypothetical protein ASPBRDRAFT_491493 [Aspergillus brasiliensis CBS 101740]|uniref:Secreted protein n=1 Tax=Aspergillus brasiliensis (strain CBS 101740 / IMI 381727 / IBT 21946) TaxID=767769 RepID=A0A1L9UN23_ASPBC|nr:hypothetical protein ASPBRDRAFT_491493 [Aspergillus brasiliensis CBS 101740]
MNVWMTECSWLVWFWCHGEPESAWGNPHGDAACPSLKNISYYYPSLASPTSFLGQTLGSKIFNDSIDYIRLRSYRDRHERAGMLPTRKAHTCLYASPIENRTKNPLIECVLFLWEIIGSHRPVPRLFPPRVPIRGRCRQYTSN